MTVGQFGGWRRAAVFQNGPGATELVIIPNLQQACRAKLVSGQFSSWAPIGAEQTGCDVAWKAVRADDYAVWSTDANGNFIANITPAGASGSSPVLENFETIFHQDLNGDGSIGVPTTTSAATDFHLI